MGPFLKPQCQLSWSNAVKAILSEICFERNQPKTIGLNVVKLLRLNLPFGTLFKLFADLSIQDICLNKIEKTYQRHLIVLFSSKASFNCFYICALSTSLSFFVSIKNFVSIFKIEIKKFKVN